MNLGIKRGGGEGGGTDLQDFILDWVTNCGLGFIGIWALFVIVVLRERARFWIYFEFYILQIGQIEIEYNWL